MSTAGLFGAAIGTGLLLIVLGLLPRTVDEVPAPRRRGPGRWARMAPATRRTLALGVAGGLLAALGTGWIAWVVLVPAEMLGVTRPTLSKSLTRLRNAQLIESTVTEQDRRSVYITLTDQGRDAYERLVDVGVRLIHDAKVDMTGEELRIVGGFLERFVQGLGGPAPIVLPPVAR